MARGNFGERLKRERELREVSLEEITSATRIGPRFLEALENEEWEKLPGGVFNRGFVRSVARYLGLDEESFLAEYDLAHGPIVQPSPTQQRQSFLFSSEVDSLCRRSRFPRSAGRGNRRRILRVALLRCASCDEIFYAFVVVRLDSSRASYDDHANPAIRNGH